jgi:hypothetical protein
MNVPTLAKCESAGAIPSFCWTFPGSPIRINIPLDLISKLQADLDPREDVVNSTSCAEVGGVLLGHQETPATLDIDDYVWVSSEARSDGLYHLDPSTLERLRSVTVVVGYFRTESGGDLRVRDQEISFIRKYFRDPTNVVLLIEPSRQPYTAGFFFWMKEDAFAPVSLMDFPLDAELLRLQRQSRLTDFRLIQPAEKVEKTTPRTPKIAQDGTRRMKGEEPISATSDDVRIGLWRSPFKLENSSTSASGQTKLTAPPGITRIATLSNKTSALGSARRLLATSILSALLAAAALSPLLQDWLYRSKHLPTGASVFPLQLDVEARGNGFNIEWNPQSAPITQAREGRIVILEDDKRPRIISLGLQELTNGHLYYRSSAERLQFQLEIVDRAGRFSRASVLALSSTFSPVVRPVTSPQPVHLSRRTDPQRSD